MTTIAVISAGISVACAVGHIILTIMEAPDEPWALFVKGGAFDSASADTAPLAICKAALAAKEASHD